MSDSQQLVDLFTEEFIQGRAYATIVSARQTAAEILGRPVLPGTALAKLVDESIEAGLIRAARQIISKADTPTEAYDRLLDLHDRQPNLSVRSSTSVREQAYSTPLPIAFLASTLAGINETTTVYEPTAGHGALLLNADRAKVTVNELNPDRASDLTAQGFTVTQQDASRYLPEQVHDVVIANPPFGRVKDEDSITRRFALPGNPKGTTQIDQAIALQALQSMKDTGRGVLILGSKPGRDEAERSESFNTLESRGFFYTLYQQYNVTQHFTISGDLYRKQGAGWPLDLIVIEGRGRSELPLPAAQVPRIYETFEELREVLNDAIERNRDQGNRRLPELQEGLETNGDGRSELISGESPLGDDGTELERLSRLNDASGEVDDNAVGRGGRGDTDRDTQSTGEGTIPPIFQPDSSRLYGRSVVGMGDGLGGEPNRIQRDMGDTVRPRERSSGPASVVPSDFSGGGTVETDNAEGEARERNPGAFSIGSDLRDVSESIVSGVGEQMASNVELEQPESPLNTPYLPRSQGRSPETLIPANMAVSAQIALDRVEQERGNVDEFVMERLGMTSKEQLWDVLYAEQIDSLALAFDQGSKGKIFLNGDQTGNGKGRFGASCIIDAQRQGYIPVFVTHKSNLYNSMITDLSDIGRTGFRPFMTDSDLDLKLDDGRKLKTGTLLNQSAEMQRIGQQGLAGYDAIFTTYTQLQTVSGKEPDRRHFMRAIAQKAVFIFDEAHEAGGSSGANGWKRQDEAPNRAEFVRELVDRSAGAIFMSATATKDPAVMDLYARRTDAVHAVASMENLEQTLKAGGIPLQQMMATKFVASGHLLRRERSFENISFDAKVVGVDRQVADGISTIMRAIDRFDRAKSVSLKGLDKEFKSEAKKVSEDNAIGKSGAKSTNFTSLMHNAIDQGLLSQKAEVTVQEAIAALQRGEKPIIALASTMDAFIKDFVMDQGVAPGETIDISFGDVLNRYLERSRDIVVKDYAGVEDHRPMTQDELGPEAFNTFMETKALIAQTDLSSIPLSSIDYIRARLTQEGYRVDEITGRKNTLAYGPDGGMTYKVRPGRETIPQGKIDIVNRFNDGSLDVVILNRSGATGINLHASEKFKDQKPRHMIVVQAERDINQVMQMLGRANRFGQVVEPKFTLLMGDVPAEKRLGALLVKKMASLNANTTAARNSDMSVSNVTDFMNAAGEEVVTELLKDNPELDEMLSYPLSGQSGNSDIDLISRVTGRIPLLPLADQEDLYQLIESETQALIEQKQAMGENVLEADKLDLNARTIARMQIVPDDTGIRSEFTGPAYLEVVDAKIIDKPMSQIQVINLVRENLSMPPVPKADDHDFAQATEIATALSQSRIESMTQAIESYGTVAKTRLATDEARIKLSDRLGIQLTHFENIVRSFPEGTPVQLGTAEGNLVYGVVGRIWEKPSVKGSPAASTNWRIQFLTDNRAKQITVPFSKINVSKDSAIAVSKRETRWDGTGTYESFDLKQTDRRTEMQLVTGNLLKAYEKFPRGKFVNFTDNQGNVRQGLIMPEGFDVHEELRKEPVVFKAAHQVKAFLTDVTSNLGIAEDLERILKIKIQGAARYTGDSAQTFVLQTPSATSVGGKYFLDPDLLEAVGGDFYSVSDRMEAVVPADRIDGVLKVLMEDKGVTLAAFDYKDLARNYLGEMLPTLETIESNQFAAQGDYVPFVPEPTQGTVAQLEALFIAEPLTEQTSEPEHHQPSLPDLPPANAESELLTPKSRTIADPDRQTGSAAKNVAKLLLDGGLSERILQGDDFQIQIENKPFLPLSVERHHEQIYLTHYLTQNGDPFIDSEMVFQVSADGHLKLTETAVQDPIRGSEHRALSHDFGKMFSANLLTQGYSEAIARSLQSSPRAETSTISSASPIVAPLVNAPAVPETDKVQAWTKVAASLGKTNEYLGWVNGQVKAFTDTGKLSQQGQTSLHKDLLAQTQGLNQIREWYRTALKLGKDETYLGRIQAVGEAFKSGQKLSEKAIVAMSQDLNTAQWLQFSNGVIERSPKEFTTKVAFNALQTKMPHRDILKILEEDPTYQYLKQLKGIHAAQDYSKGALVEALKQVQLAKLTPVTTMHQRIQNSDRSL